MSLSREMMRAAFGGVVICVAGYGIMKATRPTDKDFYDSLSPALKKRVDAQRSQDDRHKAYAEQLRRAQEEEESPLGAKKS
ncbi:uncharacterized protein FA14DRAFT_162203 [Meira miltonrushii]|uniref:Cytochrome b mRNA-processing protein 4 n=1 Tax=Meira miltonrushii TaxID=1280837 RepID=A0A316V651_9BASI|nr:uncharacterized protein FA14DRAFT_162203 [Meira miltonrushii]PWN33057.1 hypothetical protein FA14DRAFT_162203 [Meira miltonrushii]